MGPGGEQFIFLLSVSAHLKKKFIHFAVCLHYSMLDVTSSSQIMACSAVHSL